MKAACKHKVQYTYVLTEASYDPAWQSMAIAYVRPTQAWEHGRRSTRQSRRKEGSIGMSEELLAKALGMCEPVSSDVHFLYSARSSVTLSEQWPPSATLRQ